MVTTCRLKYCQNAAVLIFCADHLINPPIENMEFSKNIVAAPAMFKKVIAIETDTAKWNAVVAALFAINPRNIDSCTRKSFQDLIKRFNSSFLENEHNLQVKYLTAREDSSTLNKLFMPKKSTDASDEWATTEAFLTISQKRTKHQLFICADSMQVIS